MVDFRVGRPGLQWLLHFLVLWPRAACLTPVSCGMADANAVTLSKGALGLLRAPPVPSEACRGAEKGRHVCVCPAQGLLTRGRGLSSPFSHCLPLSF